MPPQSGATFGSAPLGQLDVEQLKFDRFMQFAPPACVEQFNFSAVLHPELVPCLGMFGGRYANALDRPLARAATRLTNHWPAGLRLAITLATRDAIPRLHYLG